MLARPIPGLFEGFAELNVTTARVRFSGVVGGRGPAVLLLHGYPETHAAWHAVAPGLAAHATVVIPDLPGYGRSEWTDGGGDWGKREVAAELVAMMKDLGHARFVVVGHDRGARVAYRLALDHPASVTGLAALAAVPTLDVWPAVDSEFARLNYHWFLFLQEARLVESLLAGNPDAFIDATLTKMAGSLDRLHQSALADYREAFRRPSVRAAMIRDYQAAYAIDVDHDQADRARGRKITYPTLVFWGDERIVAEGMDDGVITVVDVWRRWAKDVTAVSVASGHLIPEHAAADVIRELRRLIGRTVGGEE